MFLYYKIRKMEKNNKNNFFDGFLKSIMEKLLNIINN